MFARIGAAVVVLAMLMLATPFWHSTPLSPGPAQAHEADQAQPTTVELSSSRFLVP